MAQAQQPVLVYDRVDANRRSTLLLLAAFGLIALPATLYVALYLAFALGIVVLGFGLGSSGEGTVVALAFASVLSLGILVGAAYVLFRHASTAVLRIAGGKEMSPEDLPQLGRTVENLCIGAGLPPPRVYVVDTMAANALATGLHPESASLVVSRGLLDLLDRREMDGVIAHELVQIGNFDTRLGTVLAAGVATLRLPFVIVAGIVRFLFRVHWALGLGILLYLGLPAVAGVPFAVALTIELLRDEPLAGVLLILGSAWPLYVLFVAPVLGLVIRSAVLRGREYLADAEAVLLTRDGEGLARGLAKMSRAPSEMNAGVAMAHLYVVDPLPGDAPWWDRIFSTHPPIEERISMLVEMGGGITPSVLQAAAEAGARFRSGHGPIAVTQPMALGESAAAGDIARSDAPASGDARRPAVAFRLTGAGATLYGEPDAASKPLARLSEGALITVVDTDGEFLRVLTADDAFGYISRSAPMTEVDPGEPAT